MFHLTIIYDTRLNDQKSTHVGFCRLNIYRNKIRIGQEQLIFVGKLYIIFFICSFKITEAILGRFTLTNKGIEKDISMQVYVDCWRD